MFSIKKTLFKILTVDAFCAGQKLNDFLYKCTQTLKERT